MYTLRSDRIGNLYLSRPDGELFFQLDMDIESVLELLTAEERTHYDYGYDVTVKASEPRASILNEYFS